MKVNELKNVAMNDVSFIYVDKDGRATYPPSEMDIDNLTVIGINGGGVNNITCYIADEDSHYTMEDCY